MLIKMGEAAARMRGGLAFFVALFPFRTEKLSPPSLMILHLFVEK